MFEFKDEPAQFSLAVCLMELCWGLSPAGVCTAVVPAPAASPGSYPSSNGGFSVFHGKGVYTTRSTGKCNCGLSEIILSFDKKICLLFKYTVKGSTSLNTYRMPGQLSWINSLQQIYFSSRGAECMQDAWRFKCQSFLTDEKQQEVRLEHVTSLTVVL